MSWPEGYLSAFKDTLISNGRLSRAALEMGLDKFILSRPFTGKGWQPIYVDDMLAGDAIADTAKRSLSTKTLADAVEALIGVSFVDGRIPKALTCISIFLPEFGWKGLDDGRDILFN